MHIGGVHADHRVERVHKRQFVGQGLVARDVYDVGESLLPVAEEVGLALSSAKEVDVGVAAAVEQVDDFLGERYGVGLVRIAGKGCESDSEALAGVGGRCGGLVGKEACEVGLQVVAEAAEHVVVALDERFGGGFALEDGGSLAAALGQHGRAHAVDYEPRIDEPCAEHVVQVGDGCKVLFLQHPAQAPPAAYAAEALACVVNQSQVGGGLEEEAGEFLLGEHAHFDFGMLACERVDGRNGHGDVAKGREADHEQAVAGWFHSMRWQPDGFLGPYEAVVSVFVGAGGKFNYGICKSFYINDLCVKR